MTIRFTIILAFLLLIFILSGCASNDPSTVVEAYFQAIVNDDVERLAELTCAEKEAEAIMAATSFRGTGATLEDMQCSISATNEDYNTVSCQGKIVVTYQAELREFPLTRYRIIQQDDTWRMCGEA